MSELYIMRWPRNSSDTYVNGATIKYSKDQSVHYSNEVLSPGQVICTWASTTDYLSSGSAPSLPLLKINKIYELEIKISADNPLPIQLQISFWDDNHELLTSYRGTESRLVFTVPKATFSYEVHLVNLKHEWIRFEFLTIGEIGAVERIFESKFRRHYEWVHVRPGRDINLEPIRLIVNKGPRSILPISLREGVEEEQFFIYTDGQEVRQLIKSLSEVLRLKSKPQIIIEAGLGYYHLPSEFIAKLKEGLRQNKKLGGRNNDELDY